MSIQIANENEIVEDIWNAFKATLENDNEVSKDEESEDEESEDEESEDEESEDEIANENDNEVSKDEESEDIESDDEVELQMLYWDRVKYLREIHTNIVYYFEKDIIDFVRLGVWNAKTKCVEFDNEVLLK